MMRFAPRAAFQAGTKILFARNSPMAAHQCNKVMTAHIRYSTTRFTKDHEWIKNEGGVGTIGLTDHAQEQLGDIVFVDLPQIGSDFSQHESVGAIESVKSASEIYSPVSGKVTAVNEKLNDEPTLVNQSPMEDGWIYKIKISKPDEFEKLMDKDAYEKLLAEEEKDD